MVHSQRRKMMPSEVTNHSKVNISLTEGTCRICVGSAGRKWNLASAQKKLEAGHCPKKHKPCTSCDAFDGRTILPIFAVNVIFFAMTNTRRFMGRQGLSGPRRNTGT